MPKQIEVLKAVSSKSLSKGEKKRKAQKRLFTPLKRKSQKKAFVFVPICEPPTPSFPKLEEEGSICVIDDDKPEQMQVKEEEKIDLQQQDLRAQQELKLKHEVYEAEITLLRLLCEKQKGKNQKLQKQVSWLMQELKDCREEALKVRSASANKKKSCSLFKFISKSLFE